MSLTPLWLTLPRQERWTQPDHQFIRSDSVPVRREPGAELRLYSGATGTLVSPTRNRVPVTFVDVRLEPGAEITQLVPASYGGFLYVLEGEASVGAGRERLAPGKVGWLERGQGNGQTSLRIANAGAAPLRVLLYAGERQNTPIAWYGPFIGDTRADIVRSFERYQAGTFLRV
jgi:quercetin 2,3-dioxygenase